MQCPVYPRRNTGRGNYSPIIHKPDIRQHFRLWQGGSQVVDAGMKSCRTQVIQQACPAQDKSSRTHGKKILRRLIHGQLIKLAPEIISLSTGILSDFTNRRGWLSALRAQHLMPLLEAVMSSSLFFISMISTYISSSHSICPYFAPLTGSLISIFPLEATAKS